MIRPGQKIVGRTREPGPAQLVAQGLLPVLPVSQLLATVGQPPLHGGLALVLKNGDTSTIRTYNLPEMYYAIATLQVDLSTEAMRRVIPQQVPLADAAANAANTAAVLDLLKSGRLDELGEVMVDRLHQPYRLPLIPGAAQALDAARSNGGRIDHGNQIYFQQIGINGTSAQNDILSYFRREGEILEEGKEPSYEMQYNFLISMGEKYEGCTKVVNSLMGMFV